MAPPPAWCLPDYAGPHRVGTRLVEVSVPLHERVEVPYCPELRTLKYRAYYPTLEKHGQHPFWASKSQIDGFTQFAGVPVLSACLRHALTYLLAGIGIPAITDAPVLASKGAWPVAVFSHGLGGTDTSYSSICGNLASHGMVVFAIEHRDHSASSTIIQEPNMDAELVAYVSPVNQEDPELRRRARYMLQHRNLELRLLMKEIAKLAVGAASPYAGMLDMKALTLVGHSFGAATCLHLLDSINTNPHLTITALDGTSLKIPALGVQSTPSAIILLDIWTQPLCSTLNLSGPPILSLLSAEFRQWAINHDKWLSYVAAHNDNNNQGPECTDTSRDTAHKIEWVVIAESLHLSQSDGALLFPRCVKYLSRSTRSSSEMMHENVVRCINFLSRHRILVTDDDDDDKSTSPLLATMEAKAPRSVCTESISWRVWSSVSSVLRLV